MCVTHRRWDGDRSFIRTGLSTIRRLFPHTLKVNPSRAEHRGRQPDRSSASHAQDQTRRQRARNTLAKSRRLSLVATSASTSYSAHEIWVIRFIIRPTSTVPKWHGDDSPEWKPVVRKYPRRHSTRTGRIVATTNFSNQSSRFHGDLLPSGRISGIWGTIVQTRNSGQSRMNRITTTCIVRHRETMSTQRRNSANPPGARPSTRSMTK